MRIGYINDAATPHGGAEFSASERNRLAGFGYHIKDLEVRTFRTPEAFGEALDTLDAVYVAGGNTFTLLESLRTHGAGRVLTARVRDGLPYIGLSAGSIVTGPSIEPLALMDDPAVAPALTSYASLRLVDFVTVPHANGQLPPYPPELIAEITRMYGTTHKLRLLNDNEALLVDDGDVVKLAAK